MWAVSKTQYVSYRDRGFWADDVALGVLLKHLIDFAEPRVAGSDADWLTKAVSWWRVVAGLGGGSYGLEIDQAWSPKQLAVFVDLMNQACDLLEQREKFTAEEITAWPILDDMRLSPRGAKEIFTAPIVELGRAIVALVNGSLPEAPAGTWWIFGTPEGRGTIRKRE